MAEFGTAIKTPYDSIAETIDKWCQENYYDDFLVTLRLNGKLCVEYLIYETGDPDRPDPYWLWDSDWWEGQKNTELVGFVAAHSIFVTGTPDNYEFINMEKNNEPTQ